MRTVDIIILLITIALVSWVLINDLMDKVYEKRRQKMFSCNHKIKKEDIFSSLDERHIIPYEQNGSIYVIHEDIACHYELIQEDFYKTKWPFMFANHDIKRLLFFYDFVDLDIGMRNKEALSLIVNRVNEIYPYVVAVVYGDCIRFTYITGIVEAKEFPEEFRQAAEAFLGARDYYKLLQDQYLHGVADEQEYSMTDYKCKGTPFEFNHEWFVHVFPRGSKIIDEKKWWENQKGDISRSDLTPVQMEEYYKMIVELKAKIKEQIGYEPNRVGHCHWPNIYSWKEIAKSMEFRNHEAYKVDNKQCKHCGGNHIILIHYKSNYASWKELCGREGLMLICPDCLHILNYYRYALS